MVNSNRTIISNYNKDVNTNTIISEPITQTDYINPLSPIITLWQIPEKFSRVQVKNEDGTNTYKVEVFNLSDVINSTYFYVDYTAQNVYFHISEVGKKVTLSYMGYGSQKISSNIVFTQCDDKGNIVELLGDIVTKSRLFIDLSNTAGSAQEVINMLDEKVEMANANPILIVPASDVTTWFSTL